MKNNLYENFEERELRKIQAECDRYGYHAFLQFDEITYPYKRRRMVFCTSKHSWGNDHTDAPQLRYPG